MARTVIIAAAGSLDPQGPAAASMADLWWLMLALGTAVFVVFLGLLVAGLLRRRDPQVPAGDQDVVDAADSPALTRRWLVAGGVVMPAAILLVVFVATVRSMQAVPTAAPAGSLVVEVTGHQWWWEVHYPEAGITTANELHLPVGRPVAVHLTSADVIHSFWVPALAGKMDALPDGINTLVLEADEPGRHRTHCAEFCGLNHTDMKMLVVAEPEDAYRTWIGQHQAGAVPDSPEVPTVVVPTDGAS